MSVLIVDEQQELSQKASLALSDLNTAGGLTPEQTDRFIRTMIKQPTILNEARRVDMNSPEKEINKIKFGDRIFYAASEATAPTAGEQSKPGLSKVTLQTKEVIAEVPINDSVLEDNIEREDLQNTIVDLMAVAAARDFEELAILGDTGSGDSYLALFDGLLEMSSSHTVDAAGAKPSPSLFNDVVKAMPVQYLRNRRDFRFYVPNSVEDDYRLALASRGTGMGDAMLSSDQDIPVFGSLLRGASLMPASNMIYTNPQNIIFGIQRDVRVEMERKASQRLTNIVMTARIALEYEEEDAVVKVINIG